MNDNTHEKNKMRKSYASNVMSANLIVGEITDKSHDNFDAFHLTSSVFKGVVLRYHAAYDTGADIHVTIYICFHYCVRLHNQTKVHSTINQR